MKARKPYVAFVVCLVLLMITPHLPFHKAVATQGPRVEDLILFYYPDVESAYAALKADEIDLVGCELTHELYQDAIEDPNIVLSGVADTGIYELDLNNNYTIHRYPGVVNMLWFAPVRRAVAWCTDKNRIVDEICGGLAERIDAMVAAPAKDWANESYWYPNYPYEYDPAAASAHLDANGWVQGSTPNLNYDPGFPGSAEYLRVYGDGHPDQGTDMPAMHWYIRTDDLRRYYAGLMCADVMEKIGFTIERHEGDSPTLRPDVMVEKNYHVYTGGFDVGFLPLYLYTIWCVSWCWWETPGFYVTGVNASGLPNYPDYCDIAAKIMYPESLEEAVHAAKLATAYWTEKCITVPLFSSLSYWASQAKLLGLVNMHGVGFENGYSFMNAYKEDGTPIRYGIKGRPPNSLNPQFATLDHSYQSLDRCYSYAGVSAPPYDRSLAQAGWLQDWEVGIWDNNGVPATYMRRWVRSDSYFCEPVTGNLLSNVNASTYFFSVWYTHADPSAWRYTDVQDVHHIEIHSDYSWTTYFVSESYWFYLAASPMLYLPDRWLVEPLALSAVENFSGFTGPGPVALTGIPVWINEVTVDGTPLTFGVDYNLYGSGPGVPCTLEILTAQSGDLSVDYFAYGDPSGFTPGDLPWQDILVGSGMYYLTSFTPPAGASFKRNPYYWMDTPPLGEIDFVWNYVASTKPRSGYYDVDIYDVVMIAGAYGSTATRKPSLKYVAGADVAPVGGAINIYDVVTVAESYGQQWGHCP